MTALSISQCQRNNSSSLFPTPNSSSLSSDSPSSSSVRDDSSEASYRYDNSRPADCRTSPGKDLTEDVRSCVVGSKCGDCNHICDDLHTATSLSSQSQSSPLQSIPACSNGCEIGSSCSWSSCNSKSTGGSVYQDLLRYHDEIPLDQSDYKHIDKDKDTEGEGRSHSLSTRLYPKIVEEQEEMLKPYVVDAEERYGYKFNQCHSDARMSTGTGTFTSINDAVIGADADADAATPTEFAAEISTFYLSALEEAAFTEDEEELLLTKQHEYQYKPAHTDDNGNEASMHYTLSKHVVEGGDDNNDDNDDAIPMPSDCKKSLSTFYLSALEVAASAERFIEELSDGDDNSTDSGTALDEERFSSKSNPTSSSLSGANATQSQASTQGCRSINDFSTCSHTVTRSPAIPFDATSFLPSVMEGEESSEPKLITSLSNESTKAYITRHDENYDEEVEDQDLRIAIELSLHKLTSSPYSDADKEVDPNVSYLNREEDSFSRSYLNLEHGEEDDDAFLISQMKAMEEYQNKNNDINSNSFFDVERLSPLRNCRSSAPDVSKLTKTSQQCSDFNTNSPPSSDEMRPKRQSLLETRGETETREAILKGTSHAVKCQRCKRRLLAPISYSLVFCPKCRIVSPA